MSKVNELKPMLVYLYSVAKRSALVSGLPAQHKIIELLDDALAEAREEGRCETVYLCPFCNSPNSPIIKPGDEIFKPRLGCLDCGNWWDRPRCWDDEPRKERSKA